MQWYKAGGAEVPKKYNRCGNRGGAACWEAGIPSSNTYVRLMMICSYSNLRESSFLSGWALPWRSTSHRAKLSGTWLCTYPHPCSLTVSCTLRCLEPRQEPILRSLPSRLIRRHKRRRPKRWRRKMLKRMPEGKNKNASNKKDNDKKTPDSGWNFHEEYCIKGVLTP